MLVRSVIYGWGFDFMRPFQKDGSLLAAVLNLFILHEAARMLPRWQQLH